MGLAVAAPGTEYIQAVTERFRAANIDPSTTSHHEMSGEFTIHDVPPEPR